MKILVSACLLGACCRYDGKSVPNEDIIALGKKHQLVPVCPEQLGGLPTPREPAEIKDGRVVTRDGRDVTEQFERGAKETVKLAKTLQCDMAVLKERSPSCGCKKIYDGTFSGNTVIGNGVTARMLIQNGICVFGETDAKSYLG